MPKIKCECGFIFNLSTDSPFNYSLIPEKDVLDLIAEAGTRQITADRIDYFLSKGRKDVLLCPKCARLLVEHEADGRYTPYEAVHSKEVTGENVYGDVESSGET